MDYNEMGSSPCESNYPLRIMAEVNPHTYEIGLVAIWDYAKLDSVKFAVLTERDQKKLHAIIKRWMETHVEDLLAIKPERQNWKLGGADEN